MLMQSPCYSVAPAEVESLAQQNQNTTSATDPHLGRDDNTVPKVVEPELDLNRVGWGSFI